jgi:hypothetical protein
MSSSRILTVEDGEQNLSLGDSPFKWDVEIEQAGEGLGEELDSAPADRSSVDGAVASSVENLGRDRWFDKVVSLASRGSDKKERVSFGEISVKRNDLWESDWDVQVASSERLNLETHEVVKPAKKTWFARWIRVFFGNRVGSEDR